MQIMWCLRRFRAFWASPKVMIRHEWIEHEHQLSPPLVAGEVPLFWTSDELAQNLLYCGGTKGFAQAPRVAWVKTGF